MGWTILYIAFGIVALWLLGEVLLQYKARLRWRLLAFVGFLGVVIGVLMGSVVVIGVGAIAFAVGQTQVTLSFRRGFTTGWALGGKPGESKRRKGDPGRSGIQDPSLEVSDLEYGPGPDGPDAPYGADAGYGQDFDAAYAQAQGAAYAQGPDEAYATPGPPDQPPATPVYATEPLPDDTGQYGVYATAGDPGGGYGGYGHPSSSAPAGPPGYATAGAAPPADGAYAAAGAPPQPPAYGYDPYGQQHGYDTGGQPYPSYPEYSAGPYAQAAAAPGMESVAAAGAGAYDAQQPGAYDPYGNPPPYGYPPQDPYTSAPYGMQTPPDGVWMPQQRAADGQYGGELPPERQDPYQQGQPGGWGPSGPAGYGQGYDEQQYRY